MGLIMMNRRDFLGAVACAFAAAGIASKVPKELFEEPKKVVKDFGTIDFLHMDPNPAYLEVVFLDEDYNYGRGYIEAGVYLVDRKKGYWMQMPVDDYMAKLYTVPVPSKEETFDL